MIGSTEGNVLLYIITQLLCDKNLMTEYTMFWLLLEIQRIKPFVVGATKM